MNPKIILSICAFSIVLLAMLHTSEGLMCFTCWKFTCEEDNNGSCEEMKRLPELNGKSLDISNSWRSSPQCPEEVSDLRWDKKYIQNCTEEENSCGSYFIRITAAVARNSRQKTPFPILVTPNYYHSHIVALGCVKKAKTEIVPTTTVSLAHDVHEDGKNSSPDGHHNNNGNSSLWISHLHYNQKHSTTPSTSIAVSEKLNNQSQNSQNTTAEHPNPISATDAGRETQLSKYPEISILLVNNTATSPTTTETEIELPLSTIKPQNSTEHKNSTQLELPVSTVPGEHKILDSNLTAIHNINPQSIDITHPATPNDTIQAFIQHVHDGFSTYKSKTDAGAGKQDPIMTHEGEARAKETSPQLVTNVTTEVVTPSSEYSTIASNSPNPVVSHEGISTNKNETVAPPQGEELSSILSQPPVHANNTNETGAGNIPEVPVIPESSVHPLFVTETSLPVHDENHNDSQGYIHSNTNTSDTASINLATINQENQNLSETSSSPTVDQVDLQTASTTNNASEATSSPSGDTGLPLTFTEIVSHIHNVLNNNNETTTTAPYIPPSPAIVEVTETETNLSTPIYTSSNPDDVHINASHNHNDETNSAASVNSETTGLPTHQNETTDIQNPGYTVLQNEIHTNLTEIAVVSPGPGGSTLPLPEPLPTPELVVPDYPLLPKDSNTTENGTAVQGQGQVPAVAIDSATPHIGANDPGQPITSTINSATADLPSNSSDANENQIILPVVAVENANTGLENEKTLESTDHGLDSAAPLNTSAPSLATVGTTEIGNSTQTAAIPTSPTTPTPTSSPGPVSTADQINPTDPGPHPYSDQEPHSFDLSSNPAELYEPSSLDLIAVQSHNQQSYQYLDPFAFLSDIHNINENNNGHSNESQSVITKNDTGTGSTNETHQHTCFESFSHAWNNTQFASLERVNITAEFYVCDTCSENLCNSDYPTGPEITKLYEGSPPPAYSGNTEESVEDIKTKPGGSFESSNEKDPGSVHFNPQRPIFSKPPVSTIIPIGDDSENELYNPSTSTSTSSASNFRIFPFSLTFKISFLGLVYLFCF